MKITKFTHSCLFIEVSSQSILIDSGNYSAKYDRLLDVLPQLNTLLITHGHPDHLSISLVQELLVMYPNAQVMSNHSVKKILAKKNIEVLVEGNSFIKLEHATHGETFDQEPPENTLFTISNRFLHPGDCVSFASVPEIVALPIDGMWQYPAEIIQHVAALQPKYIIPIHEYRLKDEIITSVYNRLENFFKKEGIIFFPLMAGESVSV